MSEHEPELTPEQLIDEIKKLKVSDLLVSTITTLAQLAYAKLEKERRDLDQARMAIDAITALLPLIEGHVPAELTRDLGKMCANLQLEYASATSADL
ncbi:MAG TPA: hypothetical protein VJ645_02945 [Gaiellaceae bacterium]|nr:hypothetical protein [Gaiellaceae bacterium]